MGTRTSVYLDDALQAAVKAPGVPLAELIHRGLATGDSGEIGKLAEPAKAATSPVGADGRGEPSPGAICATPNCWQRDTRAYGLRKLPLCTASAALQGQEYKRPTPPGAARIARRGAA